MQFAKISDIAPEILDIYSTAFLKYLGKQEVYKTRFHWVCQWAVFTNEPQHDKTNKISVRPAKTHISLDIRPADQRLRCPHEESLGP